LNARNTFSELLSYNVIPVVNENDTVAVQELRFGDNDTLSAQVSALKQSLVVAACEFLKQGSLRGCSLQPLKHGTFWIWITWIVQAFSSTREGALSLALGWANELEQRHSSLKEQTGE
jgi:hypothetical protein